MEHKKKTGLDLQPRDFAVLRGLFESRVMTLSHLSRLYFGSKYEYAKRRVRQLKAARLINERAMPQHRGIFVPSLLALSKTGFEALAADPHFERYPRLEWSAMEKRLDMAQSTLAHELDVVEVKVAVAMAAEQTPTLALESFSTWPRLFEFRAEHLDTGAMATLQPDGHFIVTQDDATDYSFFLELDRSSEVRHTLAIKAHSYLDYYRSGAFAVRQGGSAEEYKQHPFRVLFVLPSDERRNNVAERLLKVDGILKNFFWLATLAEVARDPLGAIWMTLGSYLAATEGTLYDPRTYSTDRRVSERDRMVAAKVEKRRLIEI